MKVLNAIVCMSLVWGCASKPPYERGLDQAFSQIENQTKRTIAEESQRVDVNNLSDFKMLVFPKDIGIHRKRGKQNTYDSNMLSSLSDSEQEEFIQSKTVYYNPLTFNFKVLLKGDCGSLSKSKAHNSFMFYRDHKFDPKTKCMVLEVKKERPKFFGKFVKDILRDDVIKKRIFLDEYLRPYGVSVDIAVKSGREKYRTRNIKNNPFDNSSSGLSLFPIDIPNLKGGETSMKEENGSLLPKNLFLIFNVKSMVKSPLCEKANIYEFRDIYGSKIRSGWCKQQNWPSTIETNRFFAIKK